MKIGIYGGEAFPIYSIHQDGFTEMNISKETLKRWKTAFNEFSKIQEEITQEMINQGKDHDVWSGHGIWEGFHLNEI